MNIEHSPAELHSDITSSQENATTAYEAPAVESVLTPDSLEREVQYAGATPLSQIKTTT